MAARNATFDYRLRPIQRVPVPVVSVGNVTTGGTGKTPFVAWLVRWFSQQGIRVAIVSRGYGAAQGKRNDEGLELERTLGDVPHVQNPDRVQGAQTAIRQHSAQLLVLDDGFQHRRLHRDLDIVLIDALNPFGFGHLLPRGLLREPLGSLRRAQCVALSRANFVEQPAREKLWSRIRAAAPNVTAIDIHYLPRQLRCSAQQVRPIAELHAQNVLAFSGIGNPGSFQQMIALCGYELAGYRCYPDHHSYASADLEDLDRWTDEHPLATAVLCTEKDLVKIPRTHIGRLPLLALVAESAIGAGEQTLVAQLSGLLPSIR